MIKNIYSFHTSRQHHDNRQQCEGVQATMASPLCPRHPQLHQWHCTNPSWFLPILFSFFSSSFFFFSLFFFSFFFFSFFFFLLSSLFFLLILLLLFLLLLLLLLLLSLPLFLLIFFFFFILISFSFFEIYFLFISHFLSHRQQLSIKSYKLKNNFRIAPSLGKTPKKTLKL